MVVLVLFCCLKGTPEEGFKDSFLLETKIAGPYLALAQDTGLPGTLPLDGAVIGISFIGTT